MSAAEGPDGREDDEYARFESLARKLVNTPKSQSSAEPVPASGEPAAEGSEREEDSRDGD
jgi:hypothetical protein